MCLGAAVSSEAIAAPTERTEAVAERISPLTRIYRGDDGGLLYLRELGGVVYGFGETPGKKYAFVLRGSVSGDLITGSWWDVPKGWRFSRGEALERGLILPKPLVETMKSQQLGFGAPESGPTGTYAWKTGGCPDFDDGGHGCKTIALVFPGDLQAYVAVNSSNNAYAGSLKSIVRDALRAALR